MKNKKHIIVVDDLESKARDIIEDLTKIFPDAEFKYFSYGNGALRYILNELKEDIAKVPDDWLIVSDMQMPMMEDGGIERDAGKWMLIHLRHIVSCDTIIVSSEAVDDEKMKGYYEGYLGSILYDSSVYMQPQYEELLSSN